MKKKEMGVMIVTYCCFCGFVLGNGGEYEIIDTEKVPELLLTLASLTQNNVEKINTWQGQISVATITAIRGEKAPYLLKKFTDTEPNNSLNEIQQVIHKSIDYKIDLENNRFFSSSNRNQPRAYRDPASNKSYLSSKWGPEELTQIVTPDHQTEISPVIWSDEQVITSRIAIKESPKPTHRIDPRDIYFIGKKTLWLTLSQLSQMIQTTEIETYNVVVKEKSTDENIFYRLEIHEPGKDQPFSAVELSKEAGFNRTFIENWYDDGSLMSQTTAEYINQDGIYLPKQWTISQYYPDGGLRYQEDCTIVHQQINESIPDNAFSELNYLQDGDTFRDKIQDKQYTVQAGNLVEKQSK